MTETVKKTINFVTKSLSPLYENVRIFEGIATAQIVDKQGEMAIVEAFIKSIPKWMESGGFIIDWHSNRVVGKALGYEPVTLKEEFTSVEVPAVKIKAEIFNRGYALDDEVWNNIKNGTYKGLSFGGAVRSGGRESVEVDGRLAYALKDIELYEISVCPNPVNPIAVITDFNMLAKAEGKKVCSGGSCYYEISKADDEGVSTWISELSREHPEWKQDQVVAVAYEKVRSGEKNKSEHTYNVNIKINDDARKAIENVVEDVLKSEKSRMYINPTVTHINQSIMSAEENKTVNKSETVPAAVAAPAFNQEEFVKAISKSFSDAIAPLTSEIKGMSEKVVKALDTPTNLSASAPGGNVSIPNNPYHGVSEQGSKTQGSKEPAKTDSVHIDEKKAEDEKEEKEEEVKKAEPIVKAKTPRPTVDAVNPVTGVVKGNSILEYVRKSGNPNALSVVARSLLFDTGSHDRVLKGEPIVQ